MSGNIAISAAASALLAVAWCKPAAAQTYDWTLTGEDTGSGTFFTTSSANGGLNVVGFTGIIDGVAVTEIGGNPGGEATSPGGYFYYDNIVYPGSAPLLDVYGILMDYNGQEANLWGNSPDPPPH